MLLVIAVARYGNIYNGVLAIFVLNRLRFSNQ